MERGNLKTGGGKQMSTVNVALLSAFYVGGMLNETPITEEMIEKLMTACNDKALDCNYDGDDFDKAYRIATEIAEDYEEFRLSEFISYSRKYQQKRHQKIYTKIAVMAPSGSGKTYSELIRATSMADEIEKEN